MLELCIIIPVVLLVPSRLVLIFQGISLIILFVFNPLVHFVLVLVFTIRCFLFAGDATEARNENPFDAAQCAQLVAEEEHQLENVDKEAHDLLYNILFLEGININRLHLFIAHQCQI